MWIRKTKYDPKSELSMQLIENLNLTGNVYAMLLFAVIGMIIFYLAPVGRRTVILLVESILFYALCDIRFLGLILLEAFVTWLCGRKVEENVPDRKAQADNSGEGTADGGGRKADFYTALGIVSVASILGIFKYAGFFLGEFSFSAAEIVMPLGISYYSFREISYLADIRTGKRNSEKSFLFYSAYVLLFLHIVSGPIARSENILNQFHEGIYWNESMACEGLCLVLSGMFKKLVIANRISPYVDTIFSVYSSSTGLALWLAAILYSIELYCDFAGYSEIAVGLTRMYGLPCEMNFRQPYLSIDMQQFWRRWHISLSSWLKDYIYIPLGGNRKGNVRKWGNILAVFFVCGLWHGAGLKYIVWGLYHGVWNILWREGRTLKKHLGFNVVFRQIGVFFVAMFGWIIFRAPDLSSALGYMAGMFTRTSINFASIEAAILPFTMDMSCVAYFLTIVIMTIVLLVLEQEENYHNERFQRLANVRNFVYLILILMFGIEGSGSFLYANF